MTRQGSLPRLSVISKGAFKISAAVAVTLLFAARPCLAADEERPEPPSKEERMGVDKRAQGAQLISAMISAYRNFNRGTFTDRISDDFTQDKYAFVGSVETSYYAAMPLGLDYFVNTVTSSEGKLAVSFRWNKTVVVRGKGSTLNSSGECVFVFKKDDSGWDLYDIKGQSPF